MTDIPCSVWIPHLRAEGEHVIDSVDKPPIHELLSLNGELKDSDHWSETEIEERTEALARESLVLFEL